jgi:CPSF A subunit region
MSQNYAMRNKDIYVKLYFQLGYDEILKPIGWITLRDCGYRQGLSAEPQNCWRRIPLHLQVSFSTSSYRTAKAVSLFFRVNAECTELTILHKTPVEDIPYAICSFQGRVLVGIGKMLRLYDLGKKKLLRKCENKV